MEYNDFYKKVLEDNEMIELLLKLSNDEWKKININERANVFKTIVSKFNSYYPELGECVFDFVSLKDSMEGQSIDDYIIINVNGFSKCNQFEILYSCLHELRHFYQNNACQLYGMSRKVHKLFENNDLEKIYENFIPSALGRASNYIECSDSMFIEYCMQPIEYDAEVFAVEFMEMLAKEIYTSDIDIKKCLDTCVEFRKNCSLVKGNKYDLVNFGKIPLLNIEDYIESNKEIYEEDERVYENCLKKIEEIDQLEENDVCGMFCPCLWSKYTNDIKIKLINKYLSLNNLNFSVEHEGDVFIINGKDVKDDSPIKIMEIIFSEMADYEIKNILNKKDKFNLKLVEKEIILNLSCDENIIKEEENPLFYNVQPFMLYKNYYMLRNMYMLFKCIDELCGEKYSYFKEYCKYVRKYDAEMLIKKIEILTGENFKKIYSDMLGKMKERKAR